MESVYKRSTIYLDPQLHRALKIKSAQVSKSISALVNESIKFSLAEDLEDLEAFEDRLNEPKLDFEYVLKDLRSSGKI
ncbi:MAG: CopG family transcriptional regulator [Deltaproteobacteria bacterium]|nr:MAG: CopG family transcriptional regulator [Deltaproteobacteria bacterium]